LKEKKTVRESKLRNTEGNGKKERKKERKEER
jgi:hypothetical protein